MDELPLRLKTFLLEAADEMRRAGLPPSLSSELERLSGQVDQPCVVAVVGRMKAGKSTFINALLGEDLAKVGVTETTATINYFRYGNANPAKPGRDENTCRQRRPREEWIGIPVPALIDQETYRRAQEQLERNATLSFRNNTRHSYLLRCLLTCQSCGLRMFGITPTATSGRSIPRYYRCNGKDCTGSARERRCPQKMTPADRLEEAVWGHVQQLLSDPEALLAQFRDMARQAEGGDANQQVEADKL